MATTESICDRCDGPAPRLVPAYWGEALCPDCCQLAASVYDLGGSWPDWPSPPSRLSPSS